MGTKYLKKNNIWEGFCHIFNVSFNVFTDNGLFMLAIYIMVLDPFHVDVEIPNIITLIKPNSAK
jgi:hypothetical protein